MTTTKTVYRNVPEDLVDKLLDATQKCSYREAWAEQENAASNTWSICVDVTSLFATNNAVAKQPPTDIWFTGKV